MRDGARRSFLPGRDAHVAFTAHSIPVAMARACRYEDQLRESARLVAEAVGVTDTALVYQSRSGPPHVPWLEPDILDHLRARCRPGRRRIVVIAPIGFVSDHLEVLFDLDVEARDTAAALGLNLVRASSAGTHPAFVAMIRELIEERLDGSAGAPGDRPLRREPRRLPGGLLPARARADRARGRRPRRADPRRATYVGSSSIRTLKASRQSSSPSPSIDSRHS